MKIELRNLKHMASLSEETHCYSGTVYIDGRPAFLASNHGHGGCDRYDPIAPFTHADEKVVNDWLKTNQPLTGQYADLDNCLEIVIGGIINRQLGDRIFNKLLKNKIVVLVEDKQGQPAIATYPAKFKPTPLNIHAIKSRGEKVVNGDPALMAQARELV